MIGKHALADDRRPSMPAKVLSGILAMWAMSSFACMGLLPMYAPATWELPLSVASNVVVDGAGEIYCGTQAYAQVQVYDKYGAFQRRWGVKGGGPGRLELTSDGLLRVCEGRGRYVATYELNGSLVSREEARRAGVATCSGTQSPSFPRYEMRGSMFLPGHVVRIEENGSEVDVVPARMYWYLFQAPFPSFFFFWIGAAVFYGKEVRGRLCGDNG